MNNKEEGFNDMEDRIKTTILGQSLTYLLARITEKLQT